ncbi:MAG: SH3 domain-containing protein [Oscillospiraceae bacterium]|nr:SH3 domain-containing protein [Oscillospiraceae bacterium]
MNSKIRKIISAILAAIMLLTTGIVFGRSVKVEAGDIVLQQCDPEWKNYPYGDGTLGNSGCGAFAIINAVRYLTGNTMDIYAVADWGTANEYINGVGSSFTIAPNAAAKFGSTYGFQLDTHYGFNGYVGNCYPATPAAYDAAWNTLVAKLSKGEVAVGLVHNHFISIVDYDSATNRVLVYDPGAGTKRQTTKSGDWKTYDELNYWSEEGTTYLKLRAYLTFYFATGVTAAPASTSTTPAFSGSADAAGEYIVTTDGGELNLRGAASTSSAVLTRIPNGAPVQVIESDGSWASVIYNGLSGYCSMQYLTPASKATTASSVTGTSSGTTSASVTGTTVSASSSSSVSSVTTAQLSQENAGAYVVSANGSYLNMRSGAGTSYSIVAQIPDKSEVTVTAANDEWAAVTWKGNSGYCSMAYLKKAEETTTASSQTTAATTTTTTTTASATTTSSEVSASASESSSESATSATELTSVTTETTESSDNSEPSDNTAEAGAYLVSTDGAHLNLRQSGSLSAKILAQIPNESEVFVISTDGEWSNVSWNGIVGYCKADYLTKKIIEADQSSDSISDISPAYVTMYGDVNLDGNIDMSDVVLLHKALTGAISLNKTSAANSDCYLDGTLNMIDATVIIQYVIDNCAIPVKPVV